MRRLLFAVFVLLLAACGGGGSSSSSSSPADYSAEIPAGAAIGSLQLQLNHVAKTTAKSVALVQPQAGRARLVATSDTLRFKKVADLIFGAANPDISLPAADDYKIEVVLYANGTPKRLVSHGIVENIAVVSGEVRAVSVNVSDISITVVTPASVDAGQSFTVSEPDATVLDGFGLQKAWSLDAKAEVITSSVHMAQSDTTSHIIKTPVVGSAGTLYYQAEFFINTRLLQTGESVYDWAFFTDPLSSSIRVGGLDGNDIGGLPLDTTAPQIRDFSVPGGKLGSTVISPISISAEDNAGIAGYMITNPAKLDDVDPTGPNDSRWSPAMPTSYNYDLVVNHGADNVVTLKAWAIDFKGNISAPVTRTVILNCSPVISTFTVPSGAQYTTTVPVSISAKGFDANGVLVPDSGQLRYMVTETAVEPASGDLNWAAKDPAATQFTMNYPITSVTMTPGVRQTATLHAWVKDTSGTGHGVSDSLANVVLLWDIPQVSAVDFQQSVPNGTTVTINSILGTSAPGKSINGYYVSDSPFRPAATSFPTAAPISFTFKGITSTASVTKYLYVWVRDDSGAVSASKQISVRLVAPL